MESRYDLLFTPYYSTISTENTLQTPTRHYIPYNLFCLKTRLTPEICKIDPTYTFGFRSTETDNKLIQCVVILVDGKEIQLPEDAMTNLQESIQNITHIDPDSCLVLDPHFKKEYPQAWLASVLPYLCNKFPVYLRGNAVYARLDPGDYKYTYCNLKKNIDTQLQEWYARGVLVTNITLAKQWDLVFLDNLEKDLDVGLYGAIWSDTRLGNPTEFLLQVIFEKKMCAPVPDNNVVKHFLALYLQSYTLKFVIDTHFMHVEIENIHDAIRVVSLVQSSNLVAGKVSIVPSSYTVAVSENQVIYPIRHTTFPYIISTLMAVY